MKKILVIEDEQDLREALQAKLVSEGYFVTTSETADTGLRMVLADKPDLILLDVLTHSIHASVFLQRLRELTGNNPETRVKVVVLTNLDNDMTRDKIMNFGVEAYLVKAKTPLEEVSKTIKVVLDLCEDVKTC